MPALLMLIELAGAVALLLWATRMIQTGVQRAFGPALKRGLRRFLRSGATAVLAGGLMAVALQSATGVALIVSGFAGAGLVSAGHGLAAILGADLGSALVALILQLDLSALAPALILAGLVLFRQGHRRRRQQTGRILIGAGLLLLALRLIGAATAPLRETSAFPVVLDYLAGDPGAALLVGAVMTFVCHSSVAMVLLVAELARQGLVAPALAVPLVLGINLGAALVPLYLTRGAGAAARVAPLGNLLLRGGGAVLALGLVILAGAETAAPGTWFPTGDAGGATGVIAAHLAFNAVLAMLGAGLAGPVTALLSRATAPIEGGELPGEEPRQSALNPDDLDVASVAITNASRELMVMGERIDTMLARIPGLFHTTDTDAIKALRGLDDEIDALHTGIKLYLARLPTEGLSEDETARVEEILAATIKLEQIADIVTGNVMTRVRRKAERGVEFSAEGWRELMEFCDAVIANARRALSVVLTGDVALARELVRGKERLRRLARDSEAAHIRRLRAGEPRSHETSTLHIDTVRDLKEINALLTELAHPALERARLLQPSRLAR
ncbi:Na+ cotransporter [Rhodobacteraceae bacterium WD3A24]|nr:Na+ cotransporter [Rhodobacteraceae bacterium WD3A24]